MPHLRNPWLQITKTSALEKSLDQTKAVKLCCYESVSDKVKRVEVKSSDSSEDIQVTWREVSYVLPGFSDLWLVVQATELSRTSYAIPLGSGLLRRSWYVCLCLLFRKLSISLATGYVD